jgi:hypothetical protein
MGLGLVGRFCKPWTDSGTLLAPVESPVGGTCTLEPCPRLRVTTQLPLCWNAQQTATSSASSSASPQLPHACINNSDPMVPESCLWFVTPCFPCLYYPAPNSPVHFPGLCSEDNNSRNWFIHNKKPVSLAWKGQGQIYSWAPPGGASCLSGTAWWWVSLKWWSPLKRFCFYRLSTNIYSIRN